MILFSASHLIYISYFHLSLWLVPILSALYAFYIELTTVFTVLSLTVNSALGRRSFTLLCKFAFFLKWEEPWGWGLINLAPHCFTKSLPQCRCLTDDELNWAHLKWPGGIWPFDHVNFLWFWYAFSPGFSLTAQSISSAISLLFLTR